MQYWQTRKDYTLSSGRTIRVIESVHHYSTGKRGYYKHVRNITSAMDSPIRCSRVEIGTKAFNAVHNYR